MFCVKNNNQLFVDACYNSDIALMSKLLKKNINPFFSNFKSFKFLIKNNDFQKFAWLLNYVKNNKKYNGEDISEILNYSCKHDKVDFVKYLYLTNTKLYNENIVNTAFEIAIKSSSIRVIKYFTSFFVDLKIKENVTFDLLNNLSHDVIFNLQKCDIYGKIKKILSSQENIDNLLKEHDGLDKAKLIMKHGAYEHTILLACCRFDHLEIYKYVTKNHMVLNDGMIQALFHRASEQNSKLIFKHLIDNYYFKMNADDIFRNLLAKYNVDLIDYIVIKKDFKKLNVRYIVFGSGILKYMNKKMLYASLRKIIKMNLHEKGLDLEKIIDCVVFIKNKNIKKNLINVNGFKDIVFKVENW